MIYCPAAFRVNLRMQHGVLWVNNLICLKTVKTQQPIRLIKPVLTQKRGARVQRRKQFILLHRNIRRIINPLKSVFFIKPLGKIKNVIIAFRRSSDYHLGTLPRRHKMRRMLIFYQVLAVFRNSCFDKLHRLKYAVLGFVRRKGA